MHGNVGTGRAWDSILREGRPFTGPWATGCRVGPGGPGDGVRGSRGQAQDLLPPLGRLQLAKGPASGNTGTTSGV